jgi:hypothetical protein
MILFCFFMFFLLIIFSQVYLVNLYYSYDFILFIYAIFKTKIDICYLKKKKLLKVIFILYIIYLKCLLNHFVFHLGPPTISNLRQPNPKPTKLGPIFVGKLRLDFLSLFLTTNQCDSSIRLKYLSMGAWKNTRHAKHVPLHINEYPHTF